jgi:hypothetical protein
MFSVAEEEVEGFLSIARHMNAVGEFFFAQGLLTHRQGFIEYVNRLPPWVWRRIRYQLLPRGRLRSKKRRAFDDRFEQFVRCRTVGFTSNART